MNDDLQTYIEPEMEARIVALVLGEASAFEAGELERLMDEKPELEAYQERLEKIHGLVGRTYEEFDKADWRLSDKRRGKVLSKIEEGKRENDVLLARQHEKRQARQRLIYICAACLVVSMIFLVGLQMNLSTKSSDESFLSFSAKEEIPQVAESQPLRGLDDRRANDVSVAVVDDGLSFELQKDHFFQAPDTSGMARSESRGRGSRNLESDVADALAALNEVIPTQDESRQLLLPATRSSSGRVPNDLPPEPLVVNEEIVPEMELLDDVVVAGRLFREEAGESDQWERRSSGIHSSRTTVDGVAKKPSAPAASMPGAIAAAITAPVAPPVPVMEVPALAADFGVGDDFGDGWAGTVAEGESVDREAQAFGFQRFGLGVDDENSDSPASVGDTLRWGFEPQDTASPDERMDFSKDTATTNGRLVAGKKSQPARGLYDLTPEENEEVSIPLTATAGVNLGYDDSVKSVGKPVGYETLSLDLTELSSYVVDPEAAPEAEQPGERFESDAKVAANNDFGRTRNAAEKSPAPKPRKPRILPLPGEEDLAQWSVAELEAARTGETTKADSDSVISAVRLKVGADDLDALQSDMDIDGILPVEDFESAGGIAGGGADPFSSESEFTNLEEGKERDRLSRLAVSGNEGGRYRVKESLLREKNEGVVLDPLSSGFGNEKDGELNKVYSAEFSADGSGLLAQESIRRQGGVVDSDELLTEGRGAYASGDYETAVQKYREALAELPYGTATADRREFLNKSLADGSIALTQKYRRVGKYEEARDLLEEVEKYDPENLEVQKGLDYLDDPIRTEASLTSEHTKNVDKVRRNLYKGESHYNLGDFDKAEEEFKEVLRIDPYNKAARRWMERASSVKSDYYRAAYDQTRAEMLMEVDQTWATAVPPVHVQDEISMNSKGFLFGEDSIDGGLEPEGVIMDASNDGERSIIAKGNQIIVPEVRFKNTTVEEALKFVRLRSIELDNTTLDDSHKGINIVAADSDILKRVLPDMELDQVPLKVLLDKIGETTGTTVEVDEFSYRLAKGETSEVFEPGNDDDSIPTTVAKLNQIILPEIMLRNSSMGEALEFLRLRSNELDTTTLDDEKKGLTVVIDDPKLEKKILEGRQIAELDLKNVPLRIAVEEIARQTGCKVRLEQGKVIFFSDPGKRTDKLPEGFETSTAERSDSTFSLNVSDVSFKLAKSALAGGSWPNASKVRPEEFVNALDYDDTKPTQAEKVACEIEQGTHPFMQQRNLMRIAMSTASLGRNAATPLRLTILLDQSGSMERADRAESVQRAFALLAAQMNPNDEVTLVGFARTPRLLAERVKGNEMAKLAEIIANPLTEGGTNLEEALSSGLQLAKQQFVKGAQNRIILLTDGAANLGDALPENLARQVESMRRADIAFDACGVGADGLNDDVLSSLAKQGDGRYYFLDRPEDADAGFARQIAGALRPAAKNVKVQILFNPDRVSTFKLYGFEKHKLKKEDFRNDSVDAAEMAAEESGVALYHFEPLPEGRGDIGTVSVRFLDTASNEMVERTWAIPYLPEAPLFSEAKPSLRLASVAGLFAEKLKASPVGDRVDLKRLRQEAQLLKPTFQNQARFNELQTMLQQAGD